MKYIIVLAVFIVGSSCLAAGKSCAGLLAASKKSVPKLSQQERSERIYADTQISKTSSSAVMMTSLNSMVEFTAKTLVGRYPMITEGQFSADINPKKNTIELNFSNRDTKEKRTVEFDPRLLRIEEPGTNLIAAEILPLVKKSGAEYYVQMAVGNRVAMEQVVLTSELKDGSRKMYLVYRGSKTTGTMVYEITLKPFRFKASI